MTSEGGGGELGDTNSIIQILASCEAGPQVGRGWCGAEVGMGEVVGWVDVGQRCGCGGIGGRGVHREMGGLMWGEEGGVGQRWGCGKVVWGRGGDVGQDQASGKAEAAPVLSSPYKGNVAALALPVPPPRPPPADSRMEGRARSCPTAGIGISRVGVWGDGVSLPRPPHPA